jgi:hypothetical protein
VGIDVTSFWICAAVTAASSLVSLGFSIAGLRAADSSGIIASRYALARSLAIAVGAASRNRMKTVGPAVVAALNLAALVWLLVAGL